MAWTISDSGPDAGSVENEKSFYRKSGEVFYHLGIRSSMLYLLEQPVTYENGQKWKMPQRMYLTMHQYRENIQVFEKQERPYIDGSFGVLDCCSSGEVTIFLYQLSIN